MLLEPAPAFAVGHPRIKEVKIGSLASKKQYDLIQSYITIGLDEGVKLLFGGPRKPEGLHEGYYVKSTIFTGSATGCESLARKYWGPILSVITYSSE